ncbi:HAD-IIIC family phosphatase [Bowmanella dokdonensis]|uniref:HAD family hydrolase n=1 Tax=Bowmanella dokdonensis TaxID=751969 RepID=A0A939DRB8_9ALTE|nr:HAD-IIIC family phosphatase [Bowmanella dokdonensis]MBN7827319.1 HAD family hydrolase [Bowmanella dokdonensis]
MQDLDWLPLPPDNFKELCKDLESNQETAPIVKRLADSRLSQNQCNRLYRSIVKLSDDKLQQLQQGFDKVKLGIVSNGTTDLMVPGLFISALRRGIWIEPVIADFDQALQESQLPDSTINAARPDLVLLMLDYRAFSFASQTVAGCAEGFNAEDAIQYIDQIRQGFARHGQVNCIVPTLAVPPVNLLGSLDRRLTGSLKKQIHDFNHAITPLIAQSDDYLLDVETIAAELGTHNWFDERQWLSSRLALSDQAELFYFERLAALLAGIRGKSKKCLVLDLDNTLWGGVIGDDGMEGIILGQGHPQGEAHAQLQRYAKELKACGIILAVCSKNDEINALQPFKDHLDMVLREEDIAVFVANWNDKVSNLQHIARTLNIGIDSLVFVDDNPAEREIVRMNLPQVAVPELPSDPALYVRTLMAANYFETVNFTEEDKLRAEQYRQNSQRQKLMESATDLDSYLESLEMVAVMGSFDEMSYKRVTQLINKTNQFNLTTQRYTEAQVLEFERSSQYFCLQARLMDKFGDNGIVSVVICKKTPGQWEIDTWLMSCRVIKRRLEDLMCDEIVRQALADNATKLTGQYIPSAKNALVADLYPSLGFAQQDSGSWELDLTRYNFKSPPISIE